MIEQSLPKERRLKNIFVYRDMQSRLALYFGCTTFFLIGTLAYFIGFNVIQMRTYIESYQMFPQDAIILLDNHFQNIIYILGIYVFLSILVSMVFSLLVSHKIAGSMYAIVNYVKELRRGDLGSLRHLRKEDELKPIMDELILLAGDLKKKT
jgi:hypothetical protein